MDTYCKDSEVEFMSIDYESIQRDSDINRMSLNKSPLIYPDMYSLPDPEMSINNLVAHTVPPTALDHGSRNRSYRPTSSANINLPTEQCSKQTENLHTSNNSNLNSVNDSLHVSSLNYQVIIDEARDQHFTKAPFPSRDKNSNTSSGLNKNNISTFSRDYSLNKSPDSGTLTLDRLVSPTIDESVLTSTENVFAKSNNESLNSLPSLSCNQARNKDLKISNRVPPSSKNESTNTYYFESSDHKFYRISNSRNESSNRDPNSSPRVESSQRTAGGVTRDLGSNRFHDEINRRFNECNNSRRINSNEIPFPTRDRSSNKCSKTLSSSLEDESTKGARVTPRDYRLNTLSGSSRKKSSNEDYPILMEKDSKRLLTTLRDHNSNVVNTPASSQDKSQHKSHRLPKKEKSTKVPIVSANQIQDKARPIHCSNNALMIKPIKKRNSSLESASKIAPSIMSTKYKSMRHCGKPNAKCSKSDQTININVVRKSVSKGVVHSFKLVRSGSDSSVDISIMTPLTESINQAEYRIIQPKRRLNIDTSTIIKQKEDQARDVILEKWKEMIKSVNLPTDKGITQIIGMNRNRRMSQSLMDGDHFPNSKREVVEIKNEYSEKSNRDKMVIDQRKSCSVSLENLQLNLNEANKKRLLCDDVNSFPPRKHECVKTPGVVRLVLWPSEERKITAERARKLLDSRRSFDVKSNTKNGTQGNPSDETSHTGDKTINMQEVYSVDQTLRKSIRAQERANLMIHREKKESEKNKVNVQKIVSSHGDESTSNDSNVNSNENTCVDYFNLLTDKNRYSQNVSKNTNQETLAEVMISRERSTNITGLNCAPNFGKAMEYRWNSKTSAEQEEEYKSARKNASDELMQEKLLMNERVYTPVNCLNMKINEITLTRDIHSTEPLCKKVNTENGMPYKTNYSSYESKTIVPEIETDNSRPCGEVVKSFRPSSKGDAHEFLMPHDSKRHTYYPNDHGQNIVAYSTECESDVTESSNSSITYLPSIMIKAKKIEYDHGYWQPKDRRIMSGDHQRLVQHHEVIANEESSYNHRPQNTGTSSLINQYSKPIVSNSLHKRTESTHKLPVNVHKENADKRLGANIEVLEERKTRPTALQRLERYLAEHPSKMLTQYSSSPLAGERTNNHSKENTRNVANRRVTNCHEASYNKDVSRSNSMVSTFVEGRDNMERHTNYVLFHLNSALSVLGDSSTSIEEKTESSASAYLLPAEDIEDKLSAIREISHKNSIVFEDGNNGISAEKEPSSCCLGCCDHRKVSTREIYEYRNICQDNKEMKFSEVTHSPPTAHKIRKGANYKHASEATETDSIHNDYNTSDTKKYAKKNRYYHRQEPQLPNIVTIPTLRSFVSKDYRTPLKSHRKCGDDKNLSKKKMIDENPPSENPCNVSNESVFSNRNDYYSKGIDEISQQSSENLRYSTTSRSLTGHQSIESGEVWLMDERALPESCLRDMSDFDQVEDLNLSSLMSRYQRYRCSDEKYNTLKPQSDRSPYCVVSQGDVDTSETGSTISRISVIATPFSYQDTTDQPTDLCSATMKRLNSYQLRFSNPTSWRESAKKCAHSDSNATLISDSDIEIKEENQSFYSQNDKTQKRMKSEDDKLNEFDEKYERTEKKMRIVPETELERSYKRNEMSIKVRREKRDTSTNVSTLNDEIKQWSLMRHNSQKDQEIEKELRSEQEMQNKISSERKRIGNRDIENKNQMRAKKKIQKDVNSNRNVGKRKKYAESREREVGDVGKRNDIDEKESARSKMNSVYQVTRTQHINDTMPDKTKEKIVKFNKPERNLDLNRIDKNIELLEKDLAVLSTMRYKYDKDGDDCSNTSEVNASSTSHTSLGGNYY